VWVGGALVAYLLTYLFPSPIGATLPCFAVSFLLYLGLSWNQRERGPLAAHEHLVPSASQEAR